MSEDTSGIDNSKLDTSRGSSSLLTTKSASILESVSFYNAFKLISVLSVFSGSPIVINITDALSFQITICESF